MSFALISTTTVGAGGVSSVTFSSISSAYTDLILVASVRCSTAGYGEDSLAMRFNGDSTYGNYSYSNLQHDGQGTFTKGYNSASTSAFIGLTSGGNANSNFFGTFYAEIPFYQASNRKNITSEWALENNSAYAAAGVHSAAWVGTAAITTLQIISTYGSTIGQNSVFSLYGRTKGSGGATVS